MHLQKKLLNMIFVKSKNAFYISRAVRVKFEKCVFREKKLWV